MQTREFVALFHKKRGLITLVLIGLGFLLLVSGALIASFYVLLAGLMCMTAALVIMNDVRADSEQ